MIYVVVGAVRCCFLFHFSEGLYQSLFQLFQLFQLFCIDFEVDGPAGNQACQGDEDGKRGGADWTP